MNNTSMLGHMISLEVVKITDQGAFVDAKEHGELFVPRSQIPRELQVGDTLRVFLYIDGHRVLATAKHPYLELSMTGKLRVTSIECGTVYLDLGIPKELVVPVSEQRSNFEVGSSVLIYVAMDDMGRLFGTQRFNRYIEDKIPNLNLYTKGQRVDVVAVSHTPLGFRVIVDDKYYGLIYKEEARNVIIGKRVQGFILNVREDGRLDITLDEKGRSGVEHAASFILSTLDNAGGKLSLSDKSAPEVIEYTLNMSKGKFKKAIGCSI